MNFFPHPEGRSSFGWGFPPSGVLGVKGKPHTIFFSFISGFNKLFNFLKKGFRRVFSFFKNLGFKKALSPNPSLGVSFLGKKRAPKGRSGFLTPGEREKNPGSPKPPGPMFAFPGLTWSWGPPPGPKPLKGGIWAPPFFQKNKKGHDEINLHA